MRGVLHLPLLIGICPKFPEYWMDRLHCHLLPQRRTVEDILPETFFILPCNYPSVLFSQNT